MYGLADFDPERQAHRLLVLVAHRVSGSQSSIFQGRHPRVTFHFIPTSSSWLNLVERWFGEITRDRIRRGTFDSVPALIAAIDDYLGHYNEAPRRFIWTKDADMILDKIAKCPKASYA